MKNKTIHYFIGKWGSAVAVAMAGTLFMVRSVAAAPIVQEESIVAPVLERLLVVAGAAILLAAWQRWRERRNK